MSKHCRESRRRSRSLAGFASKDLCETIPKSLPPSERLLALIESSFQHSLAVYRKELKHKEDFDVDTFQQKGTECWQKIKTILEEKNLASSAVAENAIVNESYTNSHVEKCNETIAKFQNESDKWSDQISHYRENLEKTINSSYVIDASELKNDKLFDYSNIIESASLTREKLTEQVVHALPKTESTFQVCLEIGETLHANNNNRLDTYFQPVIPDTPKTIIKKMAKTRKTMSRVKKFTS